MLLQFLAQRIYNPQIIPSIRNFSGWQYLQRLYPILLVLAIIISVVVFVLIIVIGGVQWITSGGERAGVDSARRKIINGVTGLFLLLLVFFVLIFIGRVFKVNLLGSFRINTILPVPSPTVAVQGPSPTPTNQQNCVNSGGAWTQFPNSCVDECLQIGCLDIISWGCDCGALQCWDGTSCVNNQVLPTPTLVPPGPIIIVNTPTPVPTSTPRPTATPTPRPTNTPMPTSTPRPTNTPTPIPTPTICPLPTLVTGQRVVSLSCATGITSVSLVWNPVSSAIRYAIRVDENPDSWSGTCTSINPGDTCIDNLTNIYFTRNVTAGTHYQWWVDAINSCGWSTTAVKYDFTIPVCPTPTPVPTSTPTPTPRPTNTPIPTPTPTVTPTPIPLFCYDSDGGQVITQRGTVTDNSTLPGGAIEYVTDYCASPSSVNEYFCNGVYRSQVVSRCISVSGGNCFNGACCSWVGQSCSTDSDCCTNYACQGGLCVSPDILLLEGLNTNCSNYCILSGYAGCYGIGTDDLASNGMMYLYQSGSCVLSNLYNCNTVLYGTNNVCGGHQTDWTRCRCVGAGPAIF